MTLRVASWTFPAQPEATRAAREAVREWARPHLRDAERLADLALALTEAVTNAVLHAYRDGAPGEVRIDARREADAVWVEVRDDGSGLAPRLDSPGLGLGLGLISQIADAADIRTHASGGTEVVMRFGCG